VALLGLALGALSNPASAADPLIKLEDTPQGDDIVVSAKPDPKPDQSEVTAQVRSITVSDNLFDKPLALFARPICPGVLGMPVDAAELVVGRIRDNIERVGLSLAKEGDCKPNLIVGFVGSGKTDIANMMSKTGSMLSMLTVQERRELKNETGPVHAWAVTAVRSLEGMDLIGGDTNLTQPPTLNANASHSLISLSARRDIDLSVVLMDIGAVDGMTVNQLADYATMRGVARTRPVKGTTSYGTILNLFDPDSIHPRELTTFDVAYLKSVYAGIPNIPGSQKIGSVKSQMNRELALAGKAEDDTGQN
jgi:hypothetical protein